MTTVKIDSHIQSGHNKPTDSSLVPVEIVRSMIRGVGIYHVKDARMILNSRFKGKFSDIVHETRNE
jgi:hypothetical protein